MPIFEYLCRDCQHTFSFLVLSQKDADELACPKCKSRSLEKLMSASNVGASATSSAPRADAGPSCCGGSCACH